MFSISVSGLKGQFEADGIQEAFSRYRKVIDVHIPLRQDRDREYAFVRFLHVGGMKRVLRLREELVVKGSIVFMAVAAVNCWNGRNVVKYDEINPTTEEWLARCSIGRF